MRYQLAMQIQNPVAAPVGYVDGGVQVAFQCPPALLVPVIPLPASLAAQIAALRFDVTFTAGLLEVVTANTATAAASVAIDGGPYDGLPVASIALQLVAMTPQPFE
jgi:hypothetical protein